MELKAVTLFSGAGGLDLGLQQAGFEIALAVDDNASALATHSANFGCSAMLRDLAAGPADFGEPEVDLLAAGPPCQSFSLAGKQDPADPRGDLLTVVGEFAEAWTPSAVLVENVPHAARGPNSTRWENLHRKLRQQGYRTRDIYVVATDFGLPQERRRVFLVALLGIEPPDVWVHPSQPSTLQDALAAVEQAPQHAPILMDGGRPAAQIVKHIKQGQKLSNVRSGSRNVHTWQIPEVFGTVTDSEVEVLEALLTLRRRDRTRKSGDGDPVAARTLSSFLHRPTSADLKRLRSKRYVRYTGDGYDIRSTFNGKYRRLSWSEPSPTVHTRFGDPRYFVHPDEARGFTVREAARIQGFPDDFRFLGTSKEQYTQVGNAVPPPLARAIGDSIYETLLRCST